jgi:NAD(P)-dependent dehydrogenase (short-subunit alcohol dehydrogenase family)
MLLAHADLAGKNAVLIGGAKGIGRAIARKLAHAGVNLALCDKDAAAVAAIQSELGIYGVVVLARTADVRDGKALNSFFDETERAFKSVDILVNVPGGTTRQTFIESSREDDDANLQLNLGYVLESTRRFVPLMRKSGSGGAIVNFTTIEAHRGAAGYAVYAAAKAAVTNFTRAMAVELGRERIRVNIVAPDSSASTAYVKWEGPQAERIARYASLPDAARAAAWKAYIPQQVPPGVDDIANAVLFLTSDLARTITGQVLHVDGGTSAAMGFLDWPFGDGHGPTPGPETLHRLFNADPQGPAGDNFDRNT